MTWQNIKELIVTSLSTYTSKRSKLMMSGKYTSGDHYQDGYIVMLYETLQDLSSVDQFYPLTVVGIRKLIFAYNRLSGERVIDVWKD